MDLVARPRPSELPSFDARKIASVEVHSGVCVFRARQLSGHRRFQDIVERSARIVESFQRANEIRKSNQRDAARFNVCLLSTIGGCIVSSSSIVVWTERIVAERHPCWLVAPRVSAGGTHAFRG
jgi:hypothetical protein